MITTDQARGNEARHVDWILGRTVLRGIREFHLFEVEHCQPGLNCNGDDIDPFIDAAAANTLSSKNFSGDWVKQQLQRHLLCPRIVAGVIGRMDVDLPKCLSGSNQRLFGGTCHCCR